MLNPEPPVVPLTFRGSMRAGAFTAQLFVELAVTPQMLTLSAMGRSFRIERPHLLAIEETSILGILKRGIRFRHNQPDLPSTIIFYPSHSREFVRQRIHELGWS